MVMWEGLGTRAETECCSQRCGKATAAGVPCENKIKNLAFARHAAVEMHRVKVSQPAASLYAVILALELGLDSVSLLRRSRRAISVFPAL